MTSFLYISRKFWSKSSGIKHVLAYSSCERGPKIVQMQNLPMGAKVRTLLSFNHIPQSHVVEYTEASRTTISNFLSSKSEIRSDLFVKLLRTVGIDIEEQLNRKIEEVVRGKVKTTEDLAVPLAGIIEQMEPIQRKTILDTIISEAQNIDNPSTKEMVMQLKGRR